MRVENPPRRFRTAAAVTAAAALGVAGVVAAPPAAADPVSLTLKYQCQFPLLGAQPLTVKIDSDVPKRAKVGESMPAINVETLSTVGEKSAQGLREVGSKTLEGTAHASVTVVAPQGNVPVRVPATLAKKELPASGGFEISAPGKTPPIRFSKPGQAKINLGGLVLTLTPRLADGTPTGLETFESECTLDEGQNVTLATVEVYEDGNGGEDKVPPSVPSGVTAKATTTTASLSWTASTDEGSGVAGYEVLDSSGNVVATSTAPNATVGELTADTEYAFRVRAKDKAGNVSQPSAPVTVRTEKYPPDHPEGSFAIKGSTSVKAANGTAPLVGAIDVGLQSAGEFSGTLVLNPTQGDFKVLGFLPVRAGIVLEPQGKVTGTIEGGKVVANTTVQTKLPTFQLFGAIPLGGGANCRTEKPSAIKLTSQGAFTFEKGGKLTGEYELSGLKDCDLLTPLLSAFTAGAGNTLDLDLTPQPRPQGQ
ncbi:fibronectin type III domain-containing protein [Actinomadura flavalba]|uniref:fibronectin type III domain-containing protein n=1 Tax=Actinomadura flavalba TaxID=1120938 RepID=UPI000376ED11|nr:fibronectin type III domain-containing protein [Actinomadura flavalba]